MKKYYEKLKKLSPLALAVLSLGILAPMPAFADGGVWGYLANFGLTGLLSSLDAIGYLIGYIAGEFVFLGGTLVNWTLDMNSQVLISPTVHTGWVVSRDIANLGFVLAIILIAFTTILRMDSYDTKKMLWKLIVATLLINFSMVFAGLFVDFSGVFTNFFINKATGYNESKLGPGLANAFQTSKILQQTDDESKIKKFVEGLSSDPNAHIPFTASIFFVAIFTVIVAISLISMAAMLFMRYIWLTMLLILMPIAWLMWVWPDLQGKWSTWWSEFLRWCFFGPAVSFFLYLALAIAEHPVAPIAGVEAMGLTFANFGQMVAQMISVLGILYGGMYTANKMGIDGAGAGMMVANKVKGYMTGAVGYGGVAGGYLGRKYGLGGLDRLSTSLTGKTMNQHLQTATGALSGSLIGGDLMQTWNKSLKNSEEGNINDLMKHYDSLTKEARLQDISGGRIDPKRQAAAMASLAKNGQLEDVKKLVGDERYAGLTQMAMGMGGNVSKELTKKDPFLARLTVKPTDPQFASMTDSVLKERAMEDEREKRVNKAVNGMAGEDITKMNKKDFQKYISNARNLAQVRNSFMVASAERDDEDRNDIVKILGEEIKKLDASKEDPALLSSLISRMNYIGKSSAWAGAIIDKDLKKLIGIEKGKGDEGEGESGGNRRNEGRAGIENRPKLYDASGNEIKK